MPWQRNIAITAPTNNHNEQRRWQRLPAFVYISLINCQRTHTHTNSRLTKYLLGFTTCCCWCCTIKKIYFIMKSRKNVLWAPILDVWQRSLLWCSHIWWHTWTHTWNKLNWVVSHVVLQSNFLFILFFTKWLGSRCDKIKVIIVSDSKRFPQTHNFTSTLQVPAYVRIEESRKVEEIEMFETRFGKIVKMERFYYLSLRSFFE